MKSDAGHTLAEVVVASALGVLVLAGAIGIVIQTTKFAQGHADGFEAQQRLRVALDLIARDVRGAGAGVDRGPASGVLTGQIPAMWPRRLGRSGDVPTRVRADAVTLLAVPDTLAQATAAADVSSATRSVRVHPAVQCGTAHPACGFAPGVVMGVWDGAGSLMVWRVDGVAATDVAVRPVALAAQPIDAGAVVSELLIRGYLHDPVTQQLRFFDGDGTFQPVIDGVTSLTFTYFDGLVEVPLTALGDGPWLGSGDTVFDQDLLRISRVRVSLAVTVGRVACDEAIDVTPRNTTGDRL